MTKEELYQRFGPKLLDAIVQIVLSEINIIRTDLELPERTGEQMINAIANKLEQIPNYDWMNERP